MRSGLRHECHPVQKNVDSDRSQELDRYGARAIVCGYDDGTDESAAVGSQIPTLDMKSGLVNWADCLDLVERLLDGKVVGHLRIVRADRKLPFAIADPPTWHHLLITDDEEGPWPHPRTVFTPLSTVDPALAVQLVDQFLEIVRAQLTVEERYYTGRYATPQIDVGTEPDGQRLLRISFAGAATLTGWDGTQDEASSLVASVAFNAASSSSADFWLAEGWRTRTTFGGDEAQQ